MQNNTTFTYDVPFEVTQKQYLALMKECAGILAGQEKDGKYFVKIWLTKHTDFVKEILSENG